jgi:predicted nucleic acid-binding protein
VGKQTPTDTAAFRRSVRRLAPYGVFSSDKLNYAGRKTESIRRQFVLAAAHENNGRFDSCFHCQTLCQEKWGVELEAGEIAVATGQLVKDEKLLREPTHLSLTDKCSHELAKRIRTAKEVETAALGEWEAAVKRNTPSLSDGQVACLREDLITCTQEIIMERGVEAAIVLYPEQERYRHRLEEIKALGFSFLPKRDPSVMLARQDALKTFFNFMTPMQRQYFDNLMATAYLMSVFTLEPSAFDEVRRLTNGQRLYLDTNVLYPLLKLHGPTKYASTKRTLTLSRLLGYEVCVTPWTMTEMQRSVRAARLKLARHSSPQALADVPLSITDVDAAEAFGRAFRGRQRDTGISFADFFDLHEQVQYLLELEGVKVVADGCHIIDERDGGYDEQIAVLESVRQRDEKPRLVQEHDVKHRLLIEMLRGDEQRRPSNAGYLLLTNDHTMIRYAACKDAEEVPFAVSFEEWSERVRSLKPRTNDYDKTMAVILETPSLRMPELVSQEQVRRAIAQINLHEEYSTTIGVRMLLDKPLSDDDEAHPGEYERSRSVPSEREIALEAQVLALEEQVATLWGALAAKDEESAPHDGGGEGSQASPARSGARDRPQRELAHSDAIHTALLSSQEEQAATPTSASEPLTRQTAIRWLAASWSFFAGILVLALPLTAGWVTGGWPLVGDICCCGGAFIGGIALVRGFKLANALIALIASVLTIVVAVQAFVG